jgi:AbrB family looped-hinge helix DNA binding protein
MELALAATTLRVDRQGRLVVPIALRLALDIHPGTELQARVEDGRLVLETRGSILRRLRARFAKVPKTKKLADALIAERRADAQKEEAP